MSRNGFICYQKRLIAQHIQSPDVPSETEQKAEPEGTHDLENSKESVSRKIPEGEGTLIETDYGSYILPDGWYEFDQISTPEKPFYLKGGIGVESISSNISVECGKNRYPADAHIQFRTVITQQLAVQASTTGAVLSAVGTYMDAGDNLYIFTISEDDVNTVQYYIVGENRYVLIHVTDWMDERINDINDVAAAIANSFVWG